eukprot:TRINITY_DN16763_c0_g1_i1.p1 TRINITY_DN16763_c0_g1~~TRINITY_DN16763_c0_g1_i1.p1  ORF type:complete len:323 (+),score=36.87 TRINITY_DN16763_c0_g1_i1:738-1706(+)
MKPRDGDLALPSSQPYEVGHKGHEGNGAEEEASRNIPEETSRNLPTQSAAVEVAQPGSSISLKSQQTRVPPPSKFRRLGARHVASTPVTTAERVGQLGSFLMIGVLVYLFWSQISSPLARLQRWQLPRLSTSPFASSRTTSTWLERVERTGGIIRAAAALPTANGASLWSKFLASANSLLPKKRRKTGKPSHPPPPDIKSELEHQRKQALTLLAAGKSDPPQSDLFHGMMGYVESPPPSTNHSPSPPRPPSLISTAYMKSSHRRADAEDRKFGPKVRKRRRGKEGGGGHGASHLRGGSKVASSRQKQSRSQSRGQSEEVGRL